MCGRFKRITRGRDLRVSRRVQTPRNLRPYYNIGLAMNADVIRRDREGRRELVSCTEASCSTSGRGSLTEAPATFDARAETAAESRCSATPRAPAPHHPGERAFGGKRTR